MLLASLASLAAFAGFRACVPDEWSAVDRTRVAYHVLLVTGCTMALVALGPVLGPLAPWVAGLWFAGLATLYLAHGLAVRHWGSLMSRAVLLFGLRLLPRIAAEAPLRTALALAAVAAGFALGWGACRLDELWTGPWLRAVFGACGFFACRSAARRARRAGAFDVTIDLLAGVIRGGHGPQGPAPPFDPSLGERGAGIKRQEPSRRPTIVIFVLDSVRAINTSAYGYERRTTPFIDSLLARGARAVPLAVSNGASTESGLWSILSSRQVSGHAINSTCLHDVLQAAGFSARFLVAGLHRHSMGLDRLYGERVTEFEDRLIDETVLARVRALPPRTDEHGDFFFFHLMSAHTTSGKEAPIVWAPVKNRIYTDEGGSYDDAARLPYVNHYDNGILQADGYVEKILGALDEKGYLKDAIVAITSDHGEHVFERTPALRSHGRSLYQESIRIPFVVWDTTSDLPEPAPLADQTDIAPTILEAIGLDPPAMWHGVSVFRHARTATRIEHVARAVGVSPTRMEAVIVRLAEGVFKAIRHHRDHREVFTRSFCLTSDPGETTDLGEALPTPVATALAQAFLSSPRGSESRSPR